MIITIYFDDYYYFVPECFVKNRIYTNRYIYLLENLQSKSHFLFGPRQTGKTWLINKQLKSYKIINLLERDTFLDFSNSPQRLRQICPDKGKNHINSTFPNQGINLQRIKPSLQL